jgi:hypothetical protein
VRIILRAPVAFWGMFVLFEFGCKNPIDSRYKDPRTYTWTTDTIWYPGSSQTWMQDICASNSRDVYIAGHCSHSRTGTLWHYDGTSWNPVSTPPDNGDFDLYSVCGFAANDIFAAGERNHIPPDTGASLILHFDGSRWKEYPVEGRDIFAVRGNAPDDVWAGGWFNSVFHFDGVSWKKINVGNTLWFKDFAFLDGKAYALAYSVDQQPADSMWYYIVSWNGTLWDTLNTFLDVVLAPDPSFGIGSVSVIDGSLYSCGSVHTTGATVFRYENGTWVPMFTGASGISRVFGNASDNIFGIGPRGTLYHFNGSEWYHFTELTSDDFDYWNGWTDGKEVFIVGYSGGTWPQKSIVLHGK